MYIETRRNLIYGKIDAVNYTFLKPRKTLYFFSGVELIIQYSIDLMQHGTIKNNPLTRKLSFLIKPRINYQYTKFQPTYSNLYYGISLGLRMQL
jgi:hypothetical protein